MRKRSLVLLILLAGLLAVLLGAGSAFGTGANPQARAGARSASLQGQVTDLAAQVKALTAQVKALKKTVASNTSEIAANYTGDACLTAISGDALQGTWLVTDKVAQPALNTTFFGVPGPVDDKGACGDIRITRAQLQVPPTVGVFTKLVGWLRP